MKHQGLIISAFFAAFFLIGGYLLMSAQGIFLDWQTFRLIRTGGVFLNYAPRTARLTINGKIYEKPTLLLNNSLLIKKLKPGDYQLELAAEEFRAWQKDFSVQPGLVTEFKKINLIPEEIKKETITAAAVKNFWLTAQGPVYQTAKNQLYFGDRRLPGATVAAANADSSLLIIENDGEFFLTDLNKPKTIINLSRLFNSLKQRQLDLPGQVAIQKIFFEPLAKSRIIIATGQAVYELDLKQVQIKKLPSIDPVNIIAINEKGIFLEKSGGLAIFDPAAEKETAIVALAGIQTARINQKEGPIGLLDVMGQFHFYDPKTKEITTPFPDRNFIDFDFSPDGLYLALIGADNAIAIFDFKNETMAAADEALSGTAKQIAWLADYPHYLLIRKENTLVMKDVFGQPPFNEYQIADKIKNYAAAGRSIYSLTESQTLIRWDLK